MSLQERRNISGKIKDFINNLDQAGAVGEVYTLGTNGSARSMRWLGGRVSGGANGLDEKGFKKNGATGYLEIREGNKTTKMIIEKGKVKLRRKQFNGIGQG